MPRPKGSKKEKNQSSSSSPLPSIQLYSNEDLNWIQASIENKGGRPKKCEYEEGIMPIGSPSDISGGRVVVNPAVLRYLEQNRSLATTNKSLPMDINEGKDENSTESSVFSNDQSVEMNDFIQDDRFWDMSTYSTEFLTSARLAEWILTYPHSAKLPKMTILN